MKRIVMHWTAGTNNASTSDLEHYHEIVAGDGTRRMGLLKPEANESTRDGVYVAHTRGLNTGSIGLAMAGMFGAKDFPFTTGPYPLTQKQVDAFVKMVAEYADTYGIAVTRQTVLTHAEVQPTLGVRQSGKWDITWLPGWDKARNPIEAGDALRAMVIAEMQALGAAPVRKPAASPWAALFKALGSIFGGRK